MSGKEGLIDGDVLDGHNALLALYLNHTIDQQKGKPMRQNAENIDDIQRGLARRRRRGHRVSGIGHFVLPGYRRQERRLYCTPTQPGHSYRSVSLEIRLLCQAST